VVGEPEMWLANHIYGSQPQIQIDKLPYFSESNSPRVLNPPPFFEHYVVLFSTQTSTCCPKYGWITLKKSFPLMYGTIALSVLQQIKKYKKDKDHHGALLLDSALVPCKSHLNKTVSIGNIVQDTLLNALD
jgi:hypothetical protein